MTPETYYLPTTKYVPNNTLPVLVYRKVLPEACDEDTVTEILERHNWLKGGTWGAITKPHCHPNTHECYGIFQGSSTLLLGAGTFDSADEGKHVTMEKGDVIVIPAGVCHSSLERNKEYRYVGVYPLYAPKYEMNFCRSPDQVDDLFRKCESVDMPIADPLFGEAGPLVTIWSGI